MSEQTLALLWTLGCFALLGAWVPLLDLLHRHWPTRNERERRMRNCVKARGALRPGVQPARVEPVTPSVRRLP